MSRAFLVAFPARKMFEGLNSWFINLDPVTQAVLRSLIWIIFIFLPVPIWIWLERRLLSKMQDRIGPNRTGTITFSTRSKFVPGFLKGKKIRLLWGIPQIIADGVKAFFKEDFAPATSDKFLFYLAPALALFPPFAIGAMIPFAPWAITPVADANIGILYTFAISSLGAYGIVLAGYSSNNKYSLLGALRGSAQLISYELAMGMALAGMVMATGTLQLTGMLVAQNQPLWGAVPLISNWHIFTPFGFVAAIIFFICMTAETNRAPFDLPECESELIAGYNTEYTTKKWVLFMMAEYISMYIFSGVLITVFLGGYHLLPIRWETLAEMNPAFAGLSGFMIVFENTFAPLIYFGKCFCIISSFIWLRATLPRLRYDQLMSLGWKTLLPIATANMIVIGAWIVGTRLLEEQKVPYAGAILMGAVALALLLVYLVWQALIGRGVTADGSLQKEKFEPREVVMINVKANTAAVTPAASDSGSVGP